MAGVLIALSAPGATASAQEVSWQPPHDVSRPTAFLFGEQIAFDRSGDAVAAWTANAGKRSFTDPLYGPGATTYRVAVRPRSSERWHRERILPYPIVLPPFGDGRAFAVDVSVGETVRAHTVTLAGRVVRTQRLQATLTLPAGYQPGRK